jgi:endonuclease/exonuclease/phosphatase family metal-dependent hydrolase
MPTSPRLSRKPWSASTTDSSRPSPARQAHDGSRQATGHQSRARRSETPYSPATPSAAGKCCGCLGPARTSPSRFSAPDALPVIGEEPRVALIADIETPHGVVRVASTHLSFLPGCNLVQLRRVTRCVEQGKPPALIMGDLNLPGRVPAAIIGYRPLARHRTYPAAHLLVQLDHLLLKGELGQVWHTAALRLAVSDHRALLADLADD